MIIVGILFLTGLSPSAWALLGTQFTGRTASANNADTASGNPAGMTRLRETELNTVISFGYSFSEFELKEGTTADGTGPGSNNDLFFIPSVYFVTPVTSDLRLGFALNVPFGLGSDYSDNWAGRYRVQNSSLFLLSFSPVAAYRINSWLSLGGGLSLIYAGWESESAIRNIGGPDGKARFEGDGLGTGFNLGALAELSSRTRIGVMYRSQAEPDIETTPELNGLGPIRKEILERAGLLGRTINSDFRIPQAIQMGVYHDLTNNLALMLDVLWIDFSRFGLQSISLGDRSIALSPDWKDMWGVSLGGNYRISDTWNTGFGAFYLSEGVAAENRSLSLPLDRIIGVGAGLEWAFHPKGNLILNLIALDSGESSVDQADLVTGRIVGEYDTPYTLLLDMGIVWKF